MKAGRTTLKDISNACGYTVNTVSRALRNDSHLPESTRVLIQDTANSMGDIRNSMASSLRSGRSHIVAVIVNDLHNQHFCDLLNRMDRELRKADYNLMILCMQLDDSLAENLIHTAISLGVDGILYFPNFGQRHYIEYMTGNDMPFVLLDMRVNDVEADTVRCDDLQGGYLAGQHLAALGHRRFLFLSGIEKSSSQMDRFNGFLQAIRESGIPEENVRAVPGEQVEEALAQDNIAPLLDPMDYTAIVSFRDEVSYAVMTALYEKGISIPGDISIIIFDNLRAENFSRPALTSIYTDKSIAEIGVKLLLERMEDPSLPPRSVVLPVQIFDYGTTAKPKGSSQGSI